MNLEHIKYLRQKCKLLNLHGHEILDKYTDMQLLKICNGIGPEWFPPKIRKFVSKKFKSKQATSMIHDVDFFEQVGFGKANDRFEYNSRIEAKYDYKWFNPKRYIAISIGKRFTSLCRLFGIVAYQQAGRDAKKLKRYWKIKEVKIE